MTPNFLIKRVTLTPKFPTYGVFVINGYPICLTAERPWLNNKPSISCIPGGVYNCIPHNSQNHPYTWELENVPGRTSILIHQGNDPMADSKGCILVGMRFEGDKVTSSGIAMDKLRLKLPETFTLSIVNP